MTVAEVLRGPDIDAVAEIEGRVFDKRVYRGVRALTPPELDVYLLYSLGSEVNNGGFAQFFSNSSGSCALETATAIRRMGLSELDAIYTHALAAFPDGKPAADREARNAQLEKISSSWEDDDHAFFALGLGAREAAYLRAHVAELELPPAK
jgi:hypothetical protein